MQMGIPAFNIASSVILIMAQRLARRLCVYCKVEADLPGDALLQAGFKPDELADLNIFRAVGCDKCVQGYKGRIGVYQVMPITEALTRLILEGGHAMQIAARAKAEGIHDLRESGLNKVRTGMTSLEEIDRVTKD